MAVKSDAEGRAAAEFMSDYVVLFVFAKLGVEQGLDIAQRLFGVLASGVDHYRHAHAGRQHHDAHDALGIDALRTARDEHFTGITARKLRQLGSGPGMQTQLVADDDGDCWHKVDLEK